MASKRKIGAIITLDGQRDFKAAVTSCNKSLSTMKSEMKLVSAQTVGSANTLEALSKKHDVLQKILDEQVKKEKAVQEGLEHAQEDYQRVGTKLEEYKDKLIKAQKTLTIMEASQDTTKESIEEQKKVVEELSVAVEKGEETYQRAGSRVLDWKKDLNNAEAQTISATRALNENAAYMKEAEESTDGCAASIDAFGKQVNAAAEATEELNTSVNKVFVVEKIAEYADAFSGKMREMASAAYDAALELDEGYDTIITKTGATGKVLDSLTESANHIFEDMPVEMKDVGVAIGEVNTRFGQTGEILEKTSKEFMKFAEINGTDLNESIDAADRIMEQFGISAKQTSGFLGLLTARGQETGKSVSELMSELDQNAAMFKELDFSVEESANLLSVFETNGVDAGTALRGLKTATNNYAKEGLSTRQGLEKTIQKIKSAKTSTEALAEAQEIFGIKGAQVMADGIRDGRINLDNLSESMDDYKSTVKDTFESTLDPWDKATVAANNLKTAGSEMVGEFLEVATPAIDEATKAVKSITKGFKNLSDPAKKTISVIGAVGAAAGVAGPQIVKVYTAIKALKTATEAGKAIQTLTSAQTAMTVATETATAAQKSLNLALLANPVTLAIGGIAALTAAVAIFSDDTKSAKDATYQLAEAADSVNEKAGKAADGLDKAADKMQTAMSGNAASESTAYKLVDELEVLKNKTNLTTKEQSRMKIVVGELNAMFPEMGLEIDSVTGKLNMSSKEMKEYVKSSLEMAKIEAVQKAVKETTEKLVDAEIQRTEASRQLKETTDALEEIQKKRIEADQAIIDKNREMEETQNSYNEAIASGKGNIDELSAKIMDQSEAQIEYQGVMMTTTEAYQAMAEDEEILAEKKREQETVQKELNDSISCAQEQINTYTEYLDTNTRATNDNAEAKQKEQETAQANIQVAGQELDAYNALSEGQRQLAEDVTNSVLTMQENVQGALESQMNMFEEFNAGTEITKEQLLANMQSQVDGVIAWEQNMNALMTETKTASDGAQVAISEGLMQYLASMGPEGSTYVQQFVNMSGDELKKANELWEQSIDIKSMGDEWGQELTQSIGTLAAGGEEEWKKLGDSMKLQADKSGQYVVQGLVTGMQNAQKEAEKEGENLGIKTIESLDKGAGVASPSKKAKRSGAYTVQGLVLGIQGASSQATAIAEKVGNRVIRVMDNALSDGRETVISTAGNLSVSTVRSIESHLGFNEVYSMGVNLAYGLANGIYAGSSSVVNAVANMCAQAVNEARNRLDIHSPSRVFEKLGSYTAEGFGVGYEKQIRGINRMIREEMDYSRMPVRVQGNMMQELDGCQEGMGAPEKLVIELPIHVGKEYTKTEIVEIALKGIAQKQKGRLSAKGVNLSAVSL